MSQLRQFVQPENHTKLRMRNVIFACDLKLVIKIQCIGIA